MAQVIERRAQMFPTLSAAQLERLSKLGNRQAFERGQVIIEQGDRCPNFYVVLQGAMEVVQPDDGKELPITVHRRGEFTGETNMLSGRRSLVRTRMSEPGELLVVTPAALRRVVQFDSDLSELFMRAFILR
ncbi:MAG TPA: cyclic nucleotide-binding domain-containing protein, partial [Myxococcales bacterium]